MVEDTQSQRSKYSAVPSSVQAKFWGVSGRGDAYEAGGDLPEMEPEQMIYAAAAQSRPKAVRQSAAAAMMETGEVPVSNKTQRRMNRMQRQ